MRSTRFTGSITEVLESRLLFSHAAAIVPVAIPPIDGLRPIAIAEPGGVHPNANASAPYTPALVRSAYGIGSITFNGTSGSGAGQTIAIIDAYNDPKILADANTFSSAFSLPLLNSNGGPTFSVLGQTGSATLPAASTSSNGGWDVEESLDVEWAHAIAPSANIILYEANSASLTDLMAAVTTAAHTAGVSAVSMSFGSTEFSSESYFDNDFLTPSGHAGVTFLASTGDDDSPAEYPAYSPNVVAVGGTSLTMTTAGSYVSENAWGNTSTDVGGGGGVSSYEAQPTFQSGHVNNLGGTSSPKRTTPDVSFLADPNTGVYVYDSYYEGTNSGSYYSVGGTSLACPMWAGLVAVTDQGRALSGLSSLDGKTQLLPTLYTLSSSNFNDITTGNNGFAAGPGYDLATGLGTPVANLLVPQLVSLGAPTAGAGTHLAFNTQPPVTAVAGATFNVTVQVLDANGNLATGDTGTVTLTLTGNTAGLNGPTTASVSNGVATFTGLWITQAGPGYTLTAGEPSMAGTTSAAVQITPAAAAKLVFTAQPTNTVVNAAMAGSVSVAVEDTYGNLETADSSSLTLSPSSNGFRGGATSRTLSCTAGVAVFTAVALDAAAAYTFAAADGSLTGATSTSFTVGKATPLLSAGVSAGTYNQTAQGLSSAAATDANTAATLGTLGDGSITVAYYAGATLLGSAPTAAGSYTAVVTYAGTSNYLSVNDTVPFTIATRVLNVTAAAANKNYDRTTAATVTLSDDRLAGDALTISSAGAGFATAAAGNGVLVTAAGLTLTGANAADYTLASTTVFATANIAPLSVTGSITTADKIYDATIAAALTGTLTGILAGDNVSLTGTANFDAKNVGTNRVVTAAGLTLAGPDAGNYVLSNPTEFTTASITPRSITAVIVAASKTYDGTLAATLTSQTLSNAVPGDDVSLQLGSAPQFDVPEAGDDTVTVTGLSISGADAGNYVLTNTSASAPATINPMAVLGTILVDSKVYDGTTAATIGARAIAGVLSGDDVSLAAGAAAFADAKVANHKTVTVSGLTLAGAQADDYMLTNPTETTTASILPMVVTGTVFNDTNLNGTDDAGEPGLAGRTVYLELPGRGTKKAKSTKTAADGTFTFTNVAAGTYVIALAAKAGYRATTATSQTISLNPGGTAAGVSFGQSNSSAVTGNVFLDTTGTGKLSAADTSLAGVAVTLTGTGRSAGVTLTATTTAAGTFSFPIAPAGTYRLTAIAPAGLSLSRRSAKAYSLNLTSPKTMANCNFGELPITTATVAAPHRRAA